MERPIFSHLLYQASSVKVFAGSLPSTGKPVAIKVLHHAQKEAANSALREIMTLFQLKHPNIVEILGCYSEVCEEGMQTVLIMELMDKSLSCELKERKQRNEPWSEAELCSYLCALASALAYAQTQDISHRDIKPSNIFVSSNAIKLGDFGSAARFLHCQKRSPEFQGTLDYASPEARAYLLAMLMASAEHLSLDLPKSDVFSLGKTILELAELSDDCLESYPRLMPLLLEMVAEQPQSRPSFEEILTRLKPFTCVVCEGTYEDYAWIEKKEAMFVGSDTFPEVCSRTCLAKYRCLHIQPNDNCSLCGNSVQATSAVVLKCCHLVCQWSCLSRHVARFGLTQGSKLRIRCRSCGQSSFFAISALGECHNLLDLQLLCESCLQRPSQRKLACGHSVCSACIVVFVVEMCPLCSSL